MHAVSADEHGSHTTPNAALNAQRTTRGGDIISAETAARNWLSQNVTKDFIIHYIEH